MAGRMASARGPVAGQASDLRGRFEWRRPTRRGRPSSAERSVPFVAIRCRWRTCRRRSSRWTGWARRWGSTPAVCGSSATTAPGWPAAATRPASSSTCAPTPSPRVATRWSPAAGRQSNHVRMTAAAANKVGLACTVVLASKPPSHPTGNVVLDHLLAPDIVWAGPLDYYGTEAAIEATCVALEGEGRRPYRMPVGGASTVGALGYVEAADELLAQLARSRPGRRRRRIGWHPRRLGGRPGRPRQGARRRRRHPSRPRRAGAGQGRRGRGPRRAPRTDRSRASSTTTASAPTTAP